MNNTVGTRELKQNPLAVIKRVLDSGEDYEITSYGRPTGARIVPDRPRAQRWVSAASLATVEPISPRQAAAWRADIEDAMDDDIIDPWGGA